MTLIRLVKTFNKTKIFIIMNIVFVNMITSCVPTAKLSTRNKSPANSNTFKNTTQPTFNTTNSAYWTLSDKTPLTNVSLSTNFNTVFYLRGSSIHNYISHNTQTVLCLITDFNQTASKQLRVRAIPQSENNTLTGTVEWFLRVEPIQTANNQSICNNGLLAYDLKTVCPTCQIPSTSKNVNLFSSSNFQIGSLDLSALSLNVTPSSDLNSNNPPPSSCTNLSCQQVGLDCCLQNLCVRDLSQKANSTPSAAALADVASNLLNKKNWPQFYNICNQNPPVKPPPPIPPIDPNIAAENLRLSNIDRYNCQEGSPYLGNPSLGSIPECHIRLSGLTSDPIKPLEYNKTNQMEVKREIWTICGCANVPASPTVLTNQCPDFTYDVVKDAQNNILEVFCKPPLPTLNPLTNNLDIALNSRSAPHRFFDQASGKSYDDLSLMQQITPAVTQEGLAFSYLDETNKTTPQNNSFNMNAIIGSMVLTLNKALPAKVIKVDFDKSYVISAKSGTYTPCPSCDRDAWFNAFSSRPVSNTGKGLQSFNLSTNRSLFNDNRGLGNYSDTLFGRACFIPPTMIPFSSSDSFLLKDQRKNRLDTQAALYLNGYQRDWYGFNQGALIGSFNGVTWFAIGTGRIVTATSNKLFLAINAPFADLASNNDIMVNVILNEGLSIAANNDFDPNVGLNDSRQNQAGLCRHWHTCNTDIDCVTKLGWEYTCADTSVLKTNLAKFDINGDEIVSQTRRDVPFESILQTLLPGGSKKRCIYRGAGALCNTTYTNLPTSLQKQFTCAPNYYCATLDSGRFNSQIAREPKNLSAVLFGKDADVLGRPLNFNSATQNLPPNVILNLKDNLVNIMPSTSTFGLCRPGRAMKSTHIASHIAADPLKRSDLINGISNCNSKTVGIARVQNCPVLNMDKNSPDFGNYILDPVDTDKVSQNMCGGSSKETLSSFTGTSSFKNIEKNSSSYFSILTPALIQDACLRKAGSVCHTDLDCGPNRLHAEAALNLNSQYFGNTDAEFKYWQEDLICSQAVETLPIFGSPEFDQFSMNENRCCREIGKDFTMYTQDSDQLYDTSGLNTDLKVAKKPIDDPTARGRYSRYANVDVKDSSVSLQAGTSYNQAPIINKSNNPKAYQWKTLNDSGKLTCCGGGWVRKFSDGTNDWTHTPSSLRLSVNYGNFKCLNYTNNLFENRPPEVDPYNYSQDYDKLCANPKAKGCIQFRYTHSPTIEIINPALTTATTEVMNAFPSAENIGAALSVPPFHTLTPDAPYLPTPYTNFTKQVTADIIDTAIKDKAINFIALPPVANNSDTTNGVSFYLPSYIGGIKNIISVKIIYYKKDPTTSNVILAATPTSGFFDITNRYYDGFVHPKPVVQSSSCALAAGKSPADDIGWKTAALGGGIWCLEKIANDGVIFHAKGEFDSAGYKDWQYAGIEITYNVMGGSTYISLNGTHNPLTESLSPGNEYYYLSKLGKLELLGIPQITYEPLYCNSDKSKLVPGIYNDSTRVGYESNTNNFTYNQSLNATKTSPATQTKSLGEIYGINTIKTDDSNINNKISYSNQLSLPKVFSANDYKCCLELGKSSTNAAKCCTGFSDVAGICKLPSGADLNVYFNKFVSGDGMGETQPGGGLLDSDFIPETGEPKMNSIVDTKLIALGQAYCDAGEVLDGGAFGSYDGEPFSGSFSTISGQPAGGDTFRFGILDSLLDNDQTNNAGETQFSNGFRWNHHKYCK